MASKTEQLENKIKELEESQEKFKVLFEYAPDGCFLCDIKGFFLDGNAAAEKLVGYKKEEILGKNMLKLNLLSLDQVPKVVQRLAQHTLGNETQAEELVLTRKDGSTIPVEITGTLIKAGSQKLIFGIVRDITNRKKPTMS